MQRVDPHADNGRTRVDLNAVLTAFLTNGENDETTKRLEETGLEVLEYDRQFGYYKIRLSAEEIERHKEMLTALMKEAFDARH